VPPAVYSRDRPQVGRGGVDVALRPINRHRRQHVDHRLGRRGAELQLQASRLEMQEVTEWGAALVHGLRSPF
jgi:hypothetical protein